MTAKPRIPEVGEFVRSVGTLVEIQDVTPSPPPKEVDYIFEGQEAYIVAFANNKELNRHGTFNDFYGIGTCVAAAIKEAERLSEIYGRHLEFRVIKSTFRVRKRPKHQECFYDKEFQEFSSLSSGRGRDMPEDIEEVVWTSKTAASVGNP